MFKATWVAKSKTKVVLCELFAQWQKRESFLTKLRNTFQSVGPTALQHAMEQTFKSSFVGHCSEQTMIRMI